MRLAASSAAVMDAERESPNGSPVIKDSVRGANRESPVHAVDVEAAATAHDLVSINEALPTPGAMAGGTKGAAPCVVENGAP